MKKLKQYEFSIEIDEYIFNRFVKDKVREPYDYYEDFKDAFPNCVCNFILRDEKETKQREDKIFLWDISERKALKEKINSEMYLAKDGWRGLEYI
tara:strand:+ start:1725 stop:2009 length:285 start_codon:yes stop_codon:yes gene_type:complete